MAEKDRPGDDVPGDDEVLADAAAGNEVPDDEPTSRDGGTAVAERSSDSESPKTRKSGGRGPLSRVGNFFREIAGELRKVIWPTRKELLTYTGVVIVFVVIMTSLVAGLDYGFGKAILWALG